MCHSHSLNFFYFLCFACFRFCLLSLIVFLSILCIFSSSFFSHSVFLGRLRIRHGNDGKIMSRSPLGNGAPNSTATLEKTIAAEIVNNEINVENDVTKKLAIIMENHIGTIQKQKRIVTKLMQDNESAKHKYQVNESNSFRAHFMLAIFLLAVFFLCL